MSCYNVSVMAISNCFKILSFLCGVPEGRRFTRLRTYHSCKAKSLQRNSVILPLVPNLCTRFFPSLEPNLFFFYTLTRLFARIYSCIFSVYSALTHFLVRKKRRLFCRRSSYINPLRHGHFVIRIARARRVFCDDKYIA